MAKQAPPARRWVFTINNPDDATVDMVKDYFDGERCNYAIVGDEMGEHGTPHLQCFASLKEKIRFTALKKVIPGAHWEPARGSDVQNKAYCSKQGNVIHEVGEPRIQGNGKGTGRVLKRAKELIDIYSENPKYVFQEGDRDAMLMYGKRVKMMAAELKDDRTKKRKMINYIGVKWRPWQKKLLKELRGAPDPP